MTKLEADIKVVVDQQNLELTTVLSQLQQGLITDAEALDKIEIIKDASVTKVLEIEDEHYSPKRNVQFTLLLGPFKDGEELQVISDLRNSEFLTKYSKQKIALNESIGEVL